MSADDDEGATPEAVDVCRHDHVDTTCPHLPSELPERVEPGNKMGNDVVEDKGVGVHCHVANVGEDVAALVRQGRTTTDRERDNMAKYKRHAVE